MLLRRVTMSQQTRGGEGQIVVRKISKRSKLILGAAVASALAGMTASAVRANDYIWTGTGAPPSMWDNPASWTANSGFPTFGDNANFGNGAADFGINLNGVAQNANSANFTNTSGGYLMSNGSLSVNSINFNFSAINVGSGAVLAAAGGYGSYNSAVHNATVNLNGGTFRANGLSTGQNALLAGYYDTAIDQSNPTQKFGRLAPDLHSGNGLFTLTPDGYTALTKSINFDIPGQNGGVPGGQAATSIRTASNGFITDNNNY